MLDTGGNIRRAIIVTVNNELEHNSTIVYRSIFLGETNSLIASAVGWEAKCYDATMDKMELSDFISVFSELPDIAVFWADVHQSEAVLSLARRLKKISPETKTIVIGRATTFIPNYFQRPPFDFVHIDGDREATILDLMDYVCGKRTAQEVSGAAALVDDIYIKTAGRRLPPAEWPFPELSILPVDQYKNYTQEVHGPRYSQRISVTVAKGCTWNCSYCGATQEEGASDRRRDVSEIFDWTETADINQYGCLLHLYAPDLFFDESWIEQFVSEYAVRDSKFGWRGVTTTKTLLNRELLQRCARSGCVELAMGVEHINHTKGRPLKSSVEEIETAAKNCLDAGISLKALVMLGYPGQTEDDVAFMGKFLTSLGMTVRFTGYTPLQKLKFFTQSELDSMSLDHYDRRTYFEPESSKLSPSFFFRTITTDDGYIHA